MDSAPTLSASPDAVEAPRFLCVVFPKEADAPPTTDAPVPFGQRHVWPCAAGQVIATVVSGEEVPHCPWRPCALAMETAQLGHNAAWDAAGASVIAGKSGHIVISGNVLCVEETLDIACDLDASTGPIEFPGPAVLRHNVLDLVRLSASGDITIHGSVEAATIHSAGNVTVHHGICGKDHGCVSADGNIRARFTSNAHVHGTDVHIDNEVASSRIICRGHFASPQASVLSGHITATHGIRCDSAGSEGGVHVLLELAFSPAELKRLREECENLKALRRQSHKIRSALEPLMQHPKFLNAQQREKATELLCTAAEADEKANEIAGALAKSKEQIDILLRATIHIQHQVYPGVVIRIAGVEAAVLNPLRGPVTMTLRDEGGVITMLARDDHQRILACLPVVSSDDSDFLAHLRKGAA